MDAGEPAGAVGGATTDTSGTTDLTGPPERAEGPGPLSPSSISTFTSCALRYRFVYRDRLPEPPSPAASKGTLVHLALQRLMERPAAERTPDAAQADLERARVELSDDPDFTGLELTDDQWAEFHADAARLLHNYFLLEDPRAIDPKGLELWLDVEIGDKFRLRGIIDRLEETPGGDLVVTDYKTGNAPGAGYEQRSLGGVHLYTLMCEKHFGRRPARVQLLYLARPERIVAPASEQSVRGMEARSSAVYDAIDRAFRTGDFRARKSALCDWCSFQQFCPAFGGDPERARELAEQRRAEAEGRAPLPPLPPVPAV